MDLLLIHFSLTTLANALIRFNAVSLTAWPPFQLILSELKNFYHLFFKRQIQRYSMSSLLQSITILMAMFSYIIAKSNVPLRCSAL